MNRQDRNIEFPPSHGGAVNIVSKVPGWCGRSSGIVADTQPSVSDGFRRTSNPVVTWSLTWLSAADTIETSEPVAGLAVSCSPSTSFRADGRAGVAGRKFQGCGFPPDCRLLPAAAFHTPIERVLAVHNLQRGSAVAPL